jgi:hypothetical protein
MPEAFPSSPQARFARTTGSEIGGQILGQIVDLSLVVGQVPADIGENGEGVSVLLAGVLPRLPDLIQTLIRVSLHMYEEAGYY